MPTTSASSASSGQRSADLLEHRRESSQATNRIRERTVRANGLDFPILEAGSGRLVLCLHGFPDHAQSWAHFLDRLAQEGYWAVAPALRGYWAGGAAPDGSYRALATGQDVLALIEALGAEQADLIGHDFGARVAYAAASLDAARIRRLVGLAVPYGKSLPTAFVAAISNDEAGICSSSTPVWPRQPFSSTTLHSSTGSGENGRRGTCCRRPTVLRSMRHLANPES